MCEKELVTEQRLQHIDLSSSSGHSSVSFSFSWAAQPGAWGSALCWELVLTARSRTLLQALNCNCSIGGPEGSLCWVLFSRLHPISNWLELPVHRVILLFYAHSISSHNWPTEYATSAVLGMACLIIIERKKTVMQFTGHPLPVHQFVTVPWDFNPVPYCQPSSPTQSLPIIGQRNMQLPQSMAWHVWPDRRSIYNSLPWQQSPRLGRFSFFVEYFWVWSRLDDLFAYGWEDGFWLGVVKKLWRW